MKNLKLGIKKMISALFVTALMLFAYSCNTSQQQDDDHHEDVNYDMTDNQEHNAHGDDMMEDDEHMMDEEEMPHDTTDVDHQMQ